MVLGGLLAEEAETLIRKFEEKGFSGFLLNFDDSKLPYALRGIYRMLGRTYLFGISESEYAAGIFMLYEHMSDRNLAEVLFLFTGNEAFLVLNDIYKSVTTCRPSDEAFYSFREKLVEQGLSILTEEADLIDFEEMWTINEHRYTLYEVKPNQYAIDENWISDK